MRGMRDRETGKLRTYRIATLKTGSTPPTVRRALLHRETFFTLRKPLGFDVTLLKCLELRTTKVHITFSFSYSRQAGFRTVRYLTELIPGRFCPCRISLEYLTPPFSLLGCPLDVCSLGVDPPYSAPQLFERCLGEKTV